MDETIFDVAVIGLGYIGLPTAASFAAKGKRVAGIDAKQSTVDAVNRGEVPFVEPDSLEGKPIIGTKGIWNQAPAESSRPHTPVGASVGG